MVLPRFWAKSGAQDDHSQTTFMWRRRTGVPANRTEQKLVLFQSRSSGRFPRSDSRPFKKMTQFSYVEIHILLI
jgi:hypothetical protein